MPVNLVFFWFIMGSNEFQMKNNLSSMVKKKISYIQLVQKVQFEIIQLVNPFLYIITDNFNTIFIYNITVGYSAKLTKDQGYYKAFIISLQKTK